MQFAHTRDGGLNPTMKPTAKRYTHLIEPLIGLAAVLLIWEWVSRHVGNAVLVPPPAVVWRAFVAMLDSDLPMDIAASLFHLGIGYGLGACAGLGLALLAASSQWVEAIVDPFAEFLRPISPVAWIPLAILLFGVGPAVPVFLIFYASLFPIFVATLDGVSRVDANLIHAAQSLGASRRLVILRVVLPAALPAVVAGARLSLGVAWMSLVAGEIIGGDSGVGWRILWYQEFFQMDRVMAGILIVGALGLMADSVLRALQRRLLRWHPSSAVAQS